MNRKFNIRVGSLRDEAKPWLAGFLLAGVFITVGLVYLIQKSETKADSWILSYDK